MGIYRALRLATAQRPLHPSTQVLARGQGADLAGHAAGGLKSFRLQCVVFASHLRRINIAQPCDAAAWLGVSEDTALREFMTLTSHGLASRQGNGKATRYAITSRVAPDTHQVSAHAFHTLGVV